MCERTELLRQSRKKAAPEAPRARETANRTRRSQAARCAFRILRPRAAAKPENPANPIISSTQVEGSGTAVKEAVKRLGFRLGQPPGGVGYCVLAELFRS